jgi:phthiodiolone/phenolphthiodiolone dimycocerosates ketoreductase
MAATAAAQTARLRVCAAVWKGDVGLTDSRNMDEQTALSHVAQIPPALLRETTLNGTPDEVIAQAAQWRDCRVRYMVLLNAGPLQRSLRKGLMSVQPFTKIVRGLKKL